MRRVSTGAASGEPGYLPRRPFRGTLRGTGVKRLSSRPGVGGPSSTHQSGTFLHIRPDRRFAARSKYQEESMRRSMAMIIALALAASGSMLSRADGPRRCTFKDARGIDRYRCRPRPARVVSLSPAITEILYAAGAGPAVVGVTTYCNYPGRGAGRAQGRRLFSQDRQRRGDRRAASRTWSSASLVGARPARRAEFERAGLRFAALPRPTSSRSTRHRARWDSVAGDERRRRRLVASMRARVDGGTRAKTARHSGRQRPLVFWETWDEPLMSAGPKTFTGQIIEAAGGRNCFADSQADWPVVSFEAVLARDPDCIMAAESHGEALTLERLARRPGLGRPEGGQGRPRRPARRRHRLPGRSPLRRGARTDGQGPVPGIVQASMDGERAALAWRTRASIAALVAAFAAALAFGAVRRQAESGTALAALLAPPDADGEPEAVIARLRLTRACLAAAVGASLAASGAVFQGLFRNPLADPYVIGSSGGAAFGAVCAIAFGSGIRALWLLAIGLAAFAGGLARPSSSTWSPARPGCAPTPPASSWPAPPWGRCSPPSSRSCSRSRTRTCTRPGSGCSAASPAAACRNSPRPRRR